MVFDWEGERKKKIMGSEYFLPRLTRKFSLQNGKKIEQNTEHFFFFGQKCPSLQLSSSYLFLLCFLSFFFSHYLVPSINFRTNFTLTSHFFFFFSSIFFFFFVSCFPHFFRFFYFFIIFFTSSVLRVHFAPFFYTLFVIFFLVTCQLFLFLFL